MYGIIFSTLILIIENQSGLICFIDASTKIINFTMILPIFPKRIRNDSLHSFSV